MSDKEKTVNFKQTRKSITWPSSIPSRLSITCRISRPHPFSRISRGVSRPRPNLENNIAQSKPLDTATGVREWCRLGLRNWNLQEKAKKITPIRTLAWPLSSYLIKLERYCSYLTVLTVLIRCLSKVIVVDYCHGWCCSTFRSSPICCIHLRHILSRYHLYKFCNQEHQASQTSVHTFVRPLLEYNSATWPPHLHKHVFAIENVQRYSSYLQSKWSIIRHSPTYSRSWNSRVDEIKNGPISLL